jgi:Spy/CpxP family protein refolding chaperone
MKKKIIIGLLMVSALSFGATNNNLENMKNMYKSNQKMSYTTQMINNLTEGQKIELAKLRKEKKETNHKKGLEMRSEELKLEKLLVQDKINWKSVKQINDQISKLKAEKRLENIKFKSELEEKFGIFMGHNKGGNIGKRINRKNGNEIENQNKKRENNLEKINSGDKTMSSRIQMMNNLTENQQTELNKLIKKRKEVNYKKDLDTRFKELELEKLLVQDSINWKKVKKVNKEISNIKAEQRLDNIKFKSIIEEKYGISMGNKAKMNKKRRYE